MWTLLAATVLPRAFRSSSRDPDSAALARTRKVAREVISQYAADVDVSARFPAESIDALRTHGLLGVCVPKQYGGLGGGPRLFAAVTEELAQACGSTAIIFVMHTVAAQAIVMSSVLTSRESILKAIARGTHLTTLAFSEVGARAQFWAPVSRLLAREDGYEVSARKAWVTAAHHADSIVANAQPESSLTPYDSTLFLIRPGDTVRPAGTFNGLGLRGNDSVPVAIENARVPAGDLITPPGEGMHAMLRVVLPWFCVGTAALANGLCRAAVAGTTDHLQEAGYVSTSQKLRDLPQLRARVAEMEIRTEQSRALLARSVDDLERSPDTLLLFMLEARLAALQAAIDVTDLAMKTCGGAAFSRHLTVERVFRDARAGWVMAPTVDQLQDFIGRTITGLPVFE